MFHNRTFRNRRRNGRDGPASVLAFLQPPIRRSRPRVTPSTSSLFGSIGSRWGIIASEPASREPRRVQQSFLGPIPPIPSMAGISSVTLDRFRVSASAPVSSISPPLVPQEAFMNSSSPLAPPPRRMVELPIMLDGPVPQPSPPRRPRVVELPIMLDGPVPQPSPPPRPRRALQPSSGNGTAAGRSYQTLTVPRPFIPESRINHAVTTARLSLTNDRLMQSYWLSREDSRTRYAPQSTSKLSVMELFDLVASEPKPMTRGPPPTVEAIPKYF